MEQSNAAFLAVIQKSNDLDVHKRHAVQPQATPPLPGESAEDELAVAVAAAHNGSRFERGAKSGNGRGKVRTALELIYLAQFGSHLAGQPGLQYVVSRNTDPRIKNALAFILRFEVSF